MGQNDQLANENSTMHAAVWWLWYFADYLPTTSDFIFDIVCRCNLPYITTAVSFKLTGTQKLDLSNQKPATSLLEDTLALNFISYISAA